MNGYNNMAGAGGRKLNVQSFPRPPVVERVNRHIQIKWHGQLIADCPPGEAYWVLETHHPPSTFFCLLLTFPLPLLSCSISAPFGGGGALDVF